MLTHYRALIGALGIVSLALAVAPMRAFAGSRPGTPTQTVVNSNSNPTTVGSTVTFTATVTGNDGSIPSGNVIILQDYNQIYDIPLDTNGVAMFDVQFSNTDSIIEADYQGFGRYLASSGFTTETVNAASPDFTGAPEPASAAGLGVGALGTAGLLLRRRQPARVRS